jgi:hypothetical protein
MYNDVKIPSSAQGSGQLKSESLTSSFRNLSSGQKAIPKEDFSNVTSNRNSLGFTKLIKDLNDAVSFSSMALKSLERLSEASHNEPNSIRLVDNFVADLDKLRKNIGDTLLSLRERAQTAHIINENLQAANSNINDLSSMQVHAEQTGISIQKHKESAVSAHGEQLTPSRVEELLSE